MKAGCDKSFVGSVWYATVDGKMKCSHLHTTPKAAIKCAESWIKFQDKVAKFKSDREQAKPS